MDLLQKEVKDVLNAYQTYGVPGAVEVVLKHESLNWMEVREQLKGKIPLILLDRIFNPRYLNKR